MKRIVISLVALFALYHIGANSHVSLCEAQTNNPAGAVHPYTMTLVKSVTVDNAEAAIKTLDYINAGQLKAPLTGDSFTDLFTGKYEHMRALLEKGKKYRYRSLNGRFAAIIEGPLKERVFHRVSGITGEITVSLLDLERDIVLWKVPIPDAMKMPQIFITDDAQRVALFGCDDFQFEVIEQAAIYILDGNGSIIWKNHPQGYFNDAIRQSDDGNCLAYLVRSYEQDRGQGEHTVNLIDLRKNTQMVHLLGYLRMNSRIYTINNDGYCIVKVPGTVSGDRFICTNVRDGKTYWDKTLTFATACWLSNTGKYYFTMANQKYSINELVTGIKKYSDTVFNHVTRFAFTNDDSMVCVIEKGRLILIESSSGKILSVLKGDYLSTRNKTTVAKILSDNNVVLVFSTNKGVVEYIEIGK